METKEPKQYAVYSILRTPKGESRDNRIIEKTFDLPREVIERRKWVLNWVVAIFQVKHPKDCVQLQCSFYYPKSELHQLKASLKGKKSLLSKYNNAIEKHKEFNVQTEMFYDESNDLLLKKAINKRDYQIKLINELELLINTLQNDAR